MLKGVYKEIISVKIEDNRLYESAFFVLKKSVREEKSTNDHDLTFEANRILCENGIRLPKKKKKYCKNILFSLLFITLGAIIGFIGGFFCHFLPI